MLGAGGAARGIVFALLERGVGEVRIFNRTRDRAEALAATFGPKVKAHDWRERADRSRDASLLVNTTSLGMKGAGPLDMDVSALDSKCVVADIVYVPLETPLLAAARARGLAAVDGLGMLLHQAVPGFEKWFGVRPEVTAELRALIERDIEGGVMLVIGLTGSIGMGKSTVAARLRALGIAVCDADAEVHKLYEGAAVAPIEAAFPGTTAGGKVDRQKLAQALLDKPEPVQAPGGYRASSGVRGRAHLSSQRGRQGRGDGRARNPAAAGNRRRAPRRCRDRRAAPRPTRSARASCSGQA